MTTPICPHCGSVNVGKSKATLTIRCNDCGHRADRSHFTAHAIRPEMLQPTYGRVARAAHLDEIEGDYS